MPATSSASLELAIVLPLGVVANQLMKVEADLRFLNMRATAYAEEPSGVARQVAAHLERINETLESIRGILSNFETDIRTQSVGSTARRRPDRDRDD